MHEISIMMSILETVKKEAQKADASKVTRINLRVGKKSGVVVDSLEFAFEAIAKDTIAENAQLNIESIPAKGKCGSCGHEFEVEDFLTCDKCGNYGKIISGQELEIQSIGVE